MKLYPVSLLNILTAQALLHNTDPGTEGGGGGGLPNPAAGFQAALERHNNDATRLAATLFDDNFREREKNRILREKVPAEGSVVLSGDDAKKYQAFVDLGIEPKELKKKIDTLATLEQQNKELSQMENLREIADLGLEGSKLKLSVLKDQLAKFPDAAISFKTEKDKDGNETKVAYIKPSSDGTETPFSTFASENLADYLPALKVTAEQKPTQPGNTHDPKPNGGPTSVFDRIRTEVGKAPVDKPKSIMERFGKPANV